MAEVSEATMEHLKKAPTRKILKWLRWARAMQSGEQREQGADTGYAPWGYDEIPISVLKAELATREHIPNKLEAKAMRKARKKQGHGA